MKWCGILNSAQDNRVKGLAGAVFGYFLEKLSHKFELILRLELVFAVHRFTK